MKEEEEEGRKGRLKGKVSEGAEEGRKSPNPLCTLLMLWWKTLGMLSSSTA